MTTVSSQFTASTNPFASRYIDVLPFRLHDGDWRKLQNRLDFLGGRAAIVGANGTGKTTLIEQLGERLARDGWTIHRIRTTADGGGLTHLSECSSGPRDAILLDGAGHIGPLAWRRIVRRFKYAGRLVVTRHKPGRLPVLYRCEPSLSLLDTLVTELAPELASDLRTRSHALYAQHDGNIRNVLRSLYDDCAALS